jgi:hypothetical protein
MASTTTQAETPRPSRARGGLLISDSNCRKASIAEVLLTAGFIRENTVCSSVDTYMYSTRCIQKNGVVNWTGRNSLDEKGMNLKHLSATILATFLLAGGHQDGTPPVGQNSQPVVKAEFFIRGKAGALDIRYGSGIAWPPVYEFAREVR